MRVRLLLLLLVVCLGAGAAERTILVVESYDPGFPWDVSYKSALTARLEPAYHLEYVALDTKRLPVAQHAAMADKAWAAYLRLKPELVILGDDAALRLLVPRLAATATPAVYLGINNNPRAYFDPAAVPNVTGVLERVQAKRGIAQLRKVLPHARRLLFLLDTDFTSAVIFQEVFQRITHLSIEGLAVDIKLVASWDEWQAEVTGAARNYDALFVGPGQALRDSSTQNAHPSMDVMRWTSANASVPMFAFWDFMVGPDLATGGLVLSGRDQGAAAADIALKILGGAAPKTIYPVTADRGAFLFSRKQLRRWNLTLPPEIAAQSKFTD
ncbi:ABC transporter substrate-binding protein [Duganella callida]|uniref:Sugar ABC transporter n=1 Tax=Duganella callida TaxID=2561932 RepID=A0A4Y9SR76_9BURK|nr:ABC transporter substrate binding protein [Duganella callida]TFW27977.1 sugar ABC transporter [Duganella callida]